MAAQVALRRQQAQEEAEARELGIRLLRTEAELGTGVGNGGDGDGGDCLPHDDIVVDEDGNKVEPLDDIAAHDNDIPLDGELDSKTTDGGQTDLKEEVEEAKIGENGDAEESHQKLEQQQQVGTDDKPLPQIFRGASKRKSRSHNGTGRAIGKSKSFHFSKV